MKLKTILLASAAFALAACDSDDVAPLSTGGPLANPQDALVVQVIHAVPDAPPVNVNFGTSTLPGLDFKGSIGGIGVEPGTFAVSIDAIDAAGTIDGVVSENVTLTGNTIATIVAVGSTATIQAVVAEQPLTAPAAGNARVFVVHGVEGAGVVEVFASAAGVAPVAADSLGTFDFGDDIGPAEVPAGDYLITVTDGGAAGTVLYNGTITLSDGLDAVLVATPTTQGGTTAPLSLVGHARNANATVEFRDDDDQAFVRVGHLIPDAPGVDVLADGAELVGDLEFPDFTPIVEVAPDTYDVAVTLANDAASVVIPADPMEDTVELTFGVGTTTNVIAIGEVAADPTNIAAIVAADDPRPIAVYAKVRAIHASPTAGNVDIHVTTVGGAISADTIVAEDVALGDNTGFLALDNVADPGTPDYDIVITPTGSTTPAIDPISIELADGDVITAIARDEALGIVLNSVTVLAP